MNTRLAVRSGTGLLFCIALVVLLIQNVPDRPPKNLTTRNPPPTSDVGFDAQTWYPVVRVADGDTLVVRMNNKDVEVRLIGVNTPETADPRRPVQCFGGEASAEAKQIFSGVAVRLETDPSQGEYDKYGRLLAYVFAPSNSHPNGILANEYMIAEGYGHEYTYNLPYKYQTEFKAAERKAREEKKGLWANGVCGL